MNTVHCVLYNTLSVDLYHVLQLHILLVHRSYHTAYGWWPTKITPHTTDQHYIQADMDALTHTHTCVCTRTHARTRTHTHTHFTLQGSSKSTMIPPKKLETSLFLADSHLARGLQLNTMSVCIVLFEHSESEPLVKCAVSGLKSITSRETDKVFKYITIAWSHYGLYILTYLYNILNRGVTTCSISAPRKKSLVVILTHFAPTNCQKLVSDNQQQAISPTHVKCGFIKYERQTNINCYRESCFASCLLHGAEIACHWLSPTSFWLVTGQHIGLWTVSEPFHKGHLYCKWYCPCTIWGLAVDDWQYHMLAISLPYKSNLIRLFIKLRTAFVFRANYKRSYSCKDQSKTTVWLWDNQKYVTIAL